MILVILILAALAAVAIPRITYSITEARKQACNANVATINTMIEYAYVRDGVAYPTDNAGLTAFTGNTNYFPDGAPACPFGTAYTEANNRVQPHAH